MTDVVIGLLFIFIIMLMFFAMRLQVATHEQKEENQKQSEETQRQSEATNNLIKVTKKQTALIHDLTDAELARGDILEALEKSLKKEGVTVTVVRDEGILRLPEEILFDKSSSEIKTNVRGVDPLKTLGKALDEVLPCYTAGPRSKGNCSETKAKVEAIFIEGHTDSDQFRIVARPVVPIPVGRPSQPSSTGQGTSLFSQSPVSNAPPAGGERRSTIAMPRTNVPPRDNLDLSALRATSTFRKLLKDKPELRDYQSPNGTPVLSVSGYGEGRQIPREPGESEERFKQRNRRIDLRILMASVKSEDAKRMQEDIDTFGTYR
jgi:flagellar motor protein MotB